MRYLTSQRLPKIVSQLEKKHSLSSQTSMCLIHLYANGALHIGDWLHQMY